jgi:D-alanine-D-alanine ligase
MKNIAVLFGGTSTEHSISIKTGNFIYNTLDRSKYNCKPIFLSKSGKWLISKSFNPSLPKIENINGYEAKWEEDFSKSVDFIELNIPTDRMDCEIVFLGLHGGEGENGTIQSLLELLGLKYTGSQVLASAIAMNKEKANLLFQASGFEVSPFQVFSRLDLSDKTPLSTNMKFPVFVKPNEGGSSVGTGIAKNTEELSKRLTEVFSIEKKAIVQNLIQGIEVSCGVIEFWEKDRWTPIPLHPTEIIPNSEFFDFESKYTTGKSKEITPARLSEEITQKVRDLALKAHITLGCRAYSRTDFIIQDNIPYILETNTLPGMTETSLIPQQVKHAGKDMKDILDLILQNTD